MPKSLEKLTAAELGELFPIYLVAHNTDWPAIFLEEKMRITNLFEKSLNIKLEHIGSTAIPTIMAKPTIDIIMIISKKLIIKELTNKLISIGYIKLPKPENPPPHLLFVKGYTPKGFAGQAFHVHVRYAAHCDEICFRNYLKANKNMALEYETIKKQLAATFPNDREAYTEGKTDFVKQILAKAKKEGY